jgi:lipopolysaccharide/colanic/teichoic acid biosynthesis glycosyltransferase
MDRIFAGSENDVEASPVILDRSRPVARAPKAGLAPSLERKRLRLYIVQMLTDIGLLLGASVLVGYVYFGGKPPGQPWLAAELLLPIFLTIAWHNGTYSLDSLTDWRSSSLKMVSAVLIAAALLNFVAFFIAFNAVFSRVILVAGLTTAMIAMTGARYATSKWIRRHWGPTAINRLIIEAGGPPLDLPYAFRVDAAEHGLVPSLEDPHALDRLSRYLVNMDQVIVNCALEDRADWAKALKGSGVHGEVTSQLVRELGVLGVIDHAEADVSTLLVSTGPLGIRARITKRVFDLVLSGGALLLLSPLLLAAAVAIKLEDGGPVLFRQRRLGRGNRFFWILKFRTMRADAGDSEGHQSAMRGDDRVTRIGRFLRRTSIDELPQLINVVRGEMSLVGPRPHALGSQAGQKLFWEVDARYWQRHSLRPGLTGLAQIRGLRGATDTEDDLSSRLQADLEYLAGWTIWRDIRIVLATFPVLIHDRAF